MKTMESGDAFYSAKPDDKSDTYEVERIIGYRWNVVMKREEYLVKWRDYPLEESTFEPLHHISHCRRNLKRFYNRLFAAAELPMDFGTEDDDSIDSDILPPEAKEEESILKRLYPKEEECGIMKGWTPKGILGAQLLNEPFTYLVEYEHHRQLEHIGIELVRQNYPKMVEEFHIKIGRPYPYECGAESSERSPTG